MIFDLSATTERVKNAVNTKSIGGDDTIEFVCEKEDYGVIAEPLPANKVLPDWYKMLEGKVDVGVGKSTVKRCMPFLDALTMGWIIPLAAEFEFRYDEQAKEIEYSANFHRELISTHGPQQIGGDTNEMTQFPILKFHNYWAMKVPDGYSLLITAPFNRHEPRFKVFTGVVDGDNYFNFINAPFLWTGGEYHDVIKKGTPIIQVIPFKRNGIIGDGIIRSMTDEELDKKNTTQKTLGSHESLYRDNLWENKNASRIIDRE